MVSEACPGFVSSGADSIFKEGINIFITGRIAQEEVGRGQNILLIL